MNRALEISTASTQNGLASRCCDRPSCHEQAVETVEDANNRLIGHFCFAHAQEEFESLLGAEMLWASLYA